jgi:hypothetical protein
MMITARHPVRNAVAGIATYHDSKGEALDAVIAACADHSIDVVIPDHGFDYAGPAGSNNFRLRPANGAWVTCNCCAEKADSNLYGNVVVFSWYTMESGRIELTTYVS